MFFNLSLNNLTKMKLNLLKFFNKFLTSIKFIIQFLFYNILNIVFFYFLGKFFYNIIRFIDICLFLFGGLKTKMSFLNLRMFQLPGQFLHINENPREFEDLETSFPIYKAFFVINRAYVRIYSFYFRIGNRILQPISNFFEMLHKNRKLYYRYNVFPRKKYKQRLIDLHILFLQKFFFYKLQRDLKYLIFLIFTSIFFITCNVIFSLLLTNIICLNFFFVFVFIKIYDKILKKLIIGLKLFNYKNFNRTENPKFIKGLQLYDTVHVDENNRQLLHKKYTQYNLECEVEDMFKFLKLNIKEVFHLIKLRSEFKRQDELYMKFLFGIKDEVLGKKLKENIELGDSLMKNDILAKTLATVGYLYNWKLFSILELYEDQSKKNTIFEKRPFFRLYKYLETSFKEKNRFFEFFRYFEKFDRNYSNNKEDEKNNVLIEEFNEQQHLENDQFEVSKVKHNFFLKKIMFNFGHFNLLTDAKVFLKKMLNFYNQINKKQNKYNFIWLSYEIDFILLKYNKIRNIFFRDSYFYDNFLNVYFNYKTENGITLIKYMKLVNIEKNIFFLEKYLNDFDYFIEKLLKTHFLSYSNDNIDLILLKNSKYNKLEDQFKFVFKDLCNNEYLDIFKYYNDNLNNSLQFIIKKTRLENTIENLVYRRKEINTNKNLINYNINFLTGQNHYKNCKIKFNKYYIKASRTKNLINLGTSKKISTTKISFITLNEENLMKLNNILEKIYKIRQR